MLDHGRQRLAHLVERARQLTDFVVARYVQAHAQITGAQGLGLTHQIPQRRQFAAQQPDHRSDRQQHRQQTANGQLRTHAPGHRADLSFRHARHDRPWSAIERHGNAIEIFRGVAPELTLARLCSQTFDHRNGLIQRLHPRWRDQPFVLLVEQRQRTALANAEALEVIELDVLRVGVIEADEQHRNHLAAAITHRGVLGHVGAIEQQGATDVTLPRHQLRVGRVRVIEQGADGTGAILFGQRSADADEVFAAAHEQGGDAGGHLLELVDFLEVVVQHFAAQMQTRGLGAGNIHRLTRVNAQTCAETLLEQPAQALGAFTQRAVEGAQLVGQQPRLTGQMLFTSGEVGGVQRTQGEHRTATDNYRQYYSEREAQLRGDPSARLRHGQLLAEPRDPP
ncbi:hypothetical protein D3C72_680990 [compost metagenome]